MIDERLTLDFRAGISQKTSVLYFDVLCTIHGVLDFEFGRKKLSPQMTTDSDTVFREESIGEGFKIVTVAVFEKILLLEKIGSFLTAIFKPNACSYKIFSKIEIVDPLFPLLTYLQHFAEKCTVFELYILQDKRLDAKIAICT